MDQPSFNLILSALRDGRPSGTGWIRTTCPFCEFTLGRPDRRHSFGCKLSTGFYSCFRCGARGHVDLGDEWASMAEEEDETKNAHLPPPGFVPLASPDGQAALSLAPARDYLLNTRRLRPELWATAHIGACAMGDCGGRVIVPILGDDNQTWVGWIGRAWVKQSSMPYLNARGRWREEVLYNHAALLQVTDEPIFVVEGVFDALALWPHATALLGKASAWQVHALAHASRPIVVVLDGDAWEEGEALAYRLRLEGQRAGNIKLPPRKDPDEVPFEWLQRRAAEVL